MSEETISALRKKVRLLIADDEPGVLASLTNLLQSPLFSITACSSGRGARDLIGKATAPFHCWLLDIVMEQHDSGIALLKQAGGFPFVVMLSGMGSMNKAAEAMRLGVMAVFDKDPAALDDLHDTVCDTAALGFILDGSATKYLETFKLLTKLALATPEEWADKACITVRQLGRICALHSPLTPRYILPLFYTVRALLKRDDALESPGPTAGRFERSCFEFVDAHLDKYMF